jgi:hypothetical protein
MTPFDRASLSLSGSELPPPTVGGSPFTSGGHVARLSGDGVAVDCASDTFAAATVTNAAMIGTARRKGNSFRMCGRVNNVQGPLNVPTRLPHACACIGAAKPLVGNVTRLAARFFQRTDFARNSLGIVAIGTFFIRWYMMFVFQRAIDKFRARLYWIL